MKRITLLLVLVIISISSYAQSEELDFKNIAIIPYAYLGYPEADNLDIVQATIDDAIKTLQVSAEIISSEQTAAIFKAKGITKNNIHSNTVEDLAEILGAEAVLLGEINSASNGDANMIEILFQIVDGSSGQVVWSKAKDVHK